MKLLVQFLPWNLCLARKHTGRSLSLRGSEMHGKAQKETNCESQHKAQHWFKKSAVFTFYPVGQVCLASTDQLQEHRVLSVIPRRSHLHFTCTASHPSKGKVPGRDWVRQQRQSTDCTVPVELGVLLWQGWRNHLWEALGRPWKALLYNQVWTYLKGAYKAFCSGHPVVRI